MGVGLAIFFQEQVVFLLQVLRKANLGQTQADMVTNSKEY